MRRHPLHAALVFLTLAAGGSACARLLGDFQLDATTGESADAGADADIGTDPSAEADAAPALPVPCIPNEKWPCSCANGVESTQHCNHDGDGWKECECAVCGDGDITPGDECSSAATYCAADCCGNKTIEFDECSSTTAFCAADCCGNGTIEFDECSNTTDYCAADCCGNGTLDVDECTTGSARFCKADCCDAQGCCDPKESCFNALVNNGADVCPGSPVPPVLDALVKCLCTGMCAGPCAQSICVGTYPPDVECQGCIATPVDCLKERDTCKATPGP